MFVEFTLGDERFKKRNEFLLLESETLMLLDFRTVQFYSTHLIHKLFSLQGL